MEQFIYSLDGLALISTYNQELSRRLSPYLAKQQWGSDDRKKLLDDLADALLSSDREAIFYMVQMLGPLTTDLLYRCFRKVHKANDVEDLSAASNEHMKEKFCVVLSELCSFGSKHAKALAAAHFLESGPPFNRLIHNTPLPSKRRKVVSAASVNDILFGVSKMIKSSPTFLSFNWPWKELCQYVSEYKSKMTSVGHLALATILSAVLQLTWDEANELKSLDSWEQEYKNCSRQIKGNKCLDSEKFFDSPRVTVSKESVSYTKRAITSTDLTPNVVSICGVILPRASSGKNTLRTSGKSLVAEVVLTTTMGNSLYSMALAVANCHPVIVEGPAGCGKSTLVEYLAHTVGRENSNFIKVQLGEGIDSKVLSGMYKCTAVSGEFEWQLGALAQAVKSGYWILLEDIDKAPLDVISLLLPLLESGTLKIPGHHDASDNENAFTSSGFRIFMTCRTYGSTNVRNRSINPGVAMLRRHARCVTMEPLQGDDLANIVNTKYPKIQHLSSKVLEIYSKIEDLYMEVSGLDSKTNRRMSSVRDLFRLCNRVSAHLSQGLTESELGRVVAMESIDCLVASSMSDKERESKVHSAFALLNLSSVNADYFCRSYRPEVRFNAATASFGRVVMGRLKTASSFKKALQHFALTRSSSILLERVACAVEMCEPVLLVGETGVGKTSVIQYLAEELGNALHIVNISQQSSSSDLLGAFKPIQPKHLVSPVRDRFEKLFALTFSRKQNEKFLTHVQTCFLNKRYTDLLHLMGHSTKSALKKVAATDDVDLLDHWKELDSDILDLKQQIKAQKSVAFTFVEGILSQAIRKGDWLLLDEINLASPETLDCLSGVLESQEGSVSLLEIGDARPIKRHPNFRIFAAMNPATDVGKRNLPPSIRNRFLELFVPEPNDDSDLLTIISHYLQSRTIADKTVVNGILQFYRQVCDFSTKNAATSISTKPLFSLRSLCRALRYVNDNSKMPLNQALFEGLCLAFLTEIDHNDHGAIVNLIIKNVVGKNKAKSIMKSQIPFPSYKFATVEGYHLRCGLSEPFADPKYIVTPYVKKNLKVLSRAVSYGKYPILIQGETSTGKTSIIHYLATQTGNKVFRINNHEHTDLQEYIGCYSSDDSGKFYFQEGPLVTAMREGHWIILDELNLAPTDILESLNRVLDDNRELFIPETQETVAAHPRFTLFATQNPPGMYGGRKVLSRALRNRFIELHFGEIPSEEIKTILHQRCELPMSRCNKLVKVMQELQEQRSTSGIFAGKHGFITLRDLFRWAERYRRGQGKPDAAGTYDWDQQLANDGYILLAGRVRKPNEKLLIQETIEKHMGKRIDLNSIFSMEAVNEVLGGELPEQFQHIVLTKPLRRMVVMLHRALCFDEPVLLVGETGCGKTTACQLLSDLNKTDRKQNALFTINCHSHTDASDFLGGLRPVRHGEDGDSSIKLFEWVDGPLVRAMLEGKGILVDEISLAEDSVLERLNSVLEPTRKLIISDRVSSDGTESTLSISAKIGFQFMATMNPGGDYGKKELSPALRNRLTEIWCTAVDDDDNDVKEIIKHNLQLPSPLSDVFSDIMVNFVKWFSMTNFGVRCPKSIRDIIKWIGFCNTCTQKDVRLDPVLELVHGALLVFIDGVGSGISDSLAQQCNEARAACVSKISSDISKSVLSENVSPEVLENLDELIRGTAVLNVCNEEQTLYMGPFGITRGPLTSTSSGNYSFTAPTTAVNTFRLLRALQLPNPILLEGSPGIGKTSLVVALARIAGHDIVRINLSEQTDISDLLGADLPVEDGVGGQFSWRDGPLLSALKRGAWVVFDELNLASQSVLEGLNSVFDHRNEIFVPELGCTFHVKSDQTRIFACQNPYYQGGGRKGLPKSFLNRFNQVYMEPLSQADMVLILASQFPDLPQNLVTKMVEFNEKVREQVVEKHLWGHLGSPWEFNLRDITRWCELVSGTKDGVYRPEDYVYLLYCERLQSSGDREKMLSVFEDVFEISAYGPTRNYHLSPRILQVGNAVMERDKVIPREDEGTIVLPSMMHSMESLMTTMGKGWMSILTGRSGTGKTTLVKTLATLTGHNLKVFSVNSSMDATELLGGFEQMDFLRHLCSVIEDMCETITEHCRNCVKQLFESPSSSIMFGVMQELNQLKLAILSCKDASATLSCVPSVNAILNSIESKFGTSDVSSVLSRVAKDCQARLERVVEKIKNSKGRFEWVDSELVDALKKGDWLLIEGANLCNPSVLDRLNALLEPDGVLSITERGVVDGSFVEINPHPSFRLILSLDSSEGNLSRAMRNRGVEIHLVSSESCDERTRTCQGMLWNEVRRIIESKLLYCCLPSASLHQISTFLLKLFAENSQFRVSEQSSMVNCINCSQELSEAALAGGDMISTISSICSKFLDTNVALKLKEDLGMNLAHTFPTKIPMMSLGNIIHDTNAARVFNQAQLFDAIVEHAGGSPVEQSSLTTAAVKLFITLASANDWQMRLQFLSDHVDEYLVKDECEKHQNGKSVVAKFTTIAENLFESQLYNDVSSRDLGAEKELSNLPWDPRWSKQLLFALNLHVTPEISSNMNLLLLLFTTRLLQYDTDTKLNRLIKPILERTKEGRKKSRRKKGGAKDQSQPKSGVLVCSSLYHNGMLKLQSLPNPAIAYVFPLYQSISGFMLDVIQSQKVVLSSNSDTCKLLETISEVYLTWEDLMSSTEFDSTTFCIHIKRLLSCVELVTRILPWKDFKMLDEIGAKIQKLFEAINQAFNFDWTTVRMQSKIRRLNCRILYGAQPCQNEEHVTAITATTKLLIKVNEVISRQPKISETPSTHGMILEICDILTYLRRPDISSNSVTDSTEAKHVHNIQEASARLEELQVHVEENSHPGDQPLHENEISMQTQSFDISVHEKTDQDESLLPIVQHTVVHKLLNLISYMALGKACATRQVENSIGAVHNFLCKRKALNFRALMALLVATKTLKLNKSFSHLIPTLLAIINENDLTEVFSTTPKCDKGASVISKPFLTASTLKELCGSSFHRVASQSTKTELPLDELSAASLKVWDNLALPLSESSVKEKRLDALRSMLWETALNFGFGNKTEGNGSIVNDISLLQSCIVFFCYFKEKVHLLSELHFEAVDLLDGDTCNLIDDLVQLISQNVFTEDPSHTILKGFYSSLHEFSRQLSEFRNRTKLSNNNELDWLKEVKACLCNALRSAGNLLRIIFAGEMNNRKHTLLLSWSCLGVAWTWSSAFALALTCPQSDIDPVQLYQEKCKTLQHHVCEAEAELTVYQLYHKTMTGRILFKEGDAAISEKHIHPLLPARYQHSLGLKQKLAKASEKTAYRPSTGRFKELVKNCKQLCESAVSSDTLKSMLKPCENMISLLQSNQGQDFTNAIQVMRRIRASLTSFSAKLLDFPAFPDYTVPLEDSMNHLRLGMNLLENALEVAQGLEKENRLGLTNERFFCSMMSVRFENHVKPAALISFAKTLDYAITESGDDNASTALQSSMVEDVMISLLLRYRNLVLFEGLTSPHLEILFQLLDFVISEWNKQSEMAAQKAEEKASLYKVKHHLDDVNEEEEDENEFHEIFGIQAEVDEDTVLELDPKPVPLTTSQRSGFTERLWQISVQVHKDVMQMTGRISGTLSNGTTTSSQKEKPNKKRSNASKESFVEHCAQSVDFLLPASYAICKIGSSLVASYETMLNMGVDQNLLNANICVAKHLVDCLKGDPISILPENLCNIYHDTCVSETRRCLPIFQSLHQHINDTLLKEWPEHPVLLKIVETVSRISCFSITSPIMKFISGLEILLGLVQEWEKNACSSVSLHSFMDELTSLVYDWRKMELASWNRLINSEFQRQSAVKPSLYFSLYQLLQGEIDETNVNDVISQLEQFMESSTIAQFNSRLDTLRIFSQHLDIKGLDKSRISTCLKNMYFYYGQFSHQVTNRVEMVRKPIEKELKDFVKITKWNDRSFFALKTSVEKTRRHLFKFIKKFSQAVQEKVQCKILVQGPTTNFSLKQNAESPVIPEKDNNGTEETSNNGTTAIPSSRTEHLEKLPEMEIPEEFSILNRLPPLFQKLKKVCRKHTMSNTEKFADDVQSIEDFIGDVIENANHLKDLQPATPAKKGDDDVKAKRLAEAKNIKLRKQKALTDLFKHLSQLGLSYKKGIIRGQELATNEFLMVPLASNADQKVETTMHSSNPGQLMITRKYISNELPRRDYFYPNILKWSAFSVTSNSPHKDLAKGQLERSRGFIGHLMNITLQQREQLSSITEVAAKINEEISLLQMVAESRHHPLQHEARNFFKESRKVINDWCFLLHEFSLWMNCCPTDDDGLSERKNDCQASAMKYGDTLWSEIMKLDQQVSDVAHSAKCKLDAIEAVLHCHLKLADKHGVHGIAENLASVAESCSEIYEMCQKAFGQTSEPLGGAPSMIHQMGDFVQKFKHHEQKYRHLHTLGEEASIDSESMHMLLETSENVVSAVLIAIQKMKKLSTKTEVTSTDASDEQDLLLNLMHTNLTEDILVLNPKFVTSEIEKLCRLVADSPAQTKFIQDVTESVLPVIKEFYSVVCSLKTSLGDLHRTTTKLCFVLSGIFIQLCQNGFCTPQDMEEEMEDGEGHELEDAEGGGVGEGEGSNDVSDQIEDQEMLEDKPGDEEKDDGNNQIEASDKAIEMDNEFDGQFDDKAPEEKPEQESEGEDEEEQDVEKQMGDLGDEQMQDKLDEQFWGSDEEEEEEENEKKESEEKGKGVDKTESEIAAKDDDLGEKDKPEEDENQPGPENKEDEKPFDDSQFDPTECDPYAEQEKNEEKKEDFELGEDSKIDDQDMEENAATDEKMDEVTDDEEELGESGADDQQGAEEQQENDERDEELEPGAEDKQLADGENDNDDIDDEADQDIDFDAQQPLQAEEDAAKDSDNTISDKQTEDSKTDTKQDQLNSEEPIENKSQPEENTDPHEFQNEGNAPTNEWDDTNVQTSSVSRERKDEIEKKANTKRHEPDPQDSAKPDQTPDQDIEKRLNIVDPINSGNEKNDVLETEPRGLESDAYQHVQSPSAEYDKKAFDSAVQEEHQDMEVSNEEMVDGNDGIEELMDVEEEAQEDNREIHGVTKMESSLSMSEIHTDILKGNYFKQFVCRTDEESDKIRKELESQLQSWRQNCDAVEMWEAERAWEIYCNLTRPLAVELCEQLRLVLEPTQASQLKGDYRTGKRLNIRKMIPYIASGFRKDKIWLRRTKPNKRTYQVMLAVDDSSSMVDNHSKQLAFESVAVISSALSSLEAGELAICSFGEEVKLLQNFGDPMTTTSGAALLARCAFTQKKTKIANFLEYSTDLFQSAQRFSSSTNPNIAQLLLIISDGRGLYLEGRKRVLEAVASAHKARIFVAFIILDQPNDTQGSIIDIKVPVFNKPGEMPEIRSYMKDFPFPFYVILRNINVLPQTLGEALRQWFVLVSGSD